MGRIQSVHGANFGDEGKGRTVAWLVSESASPLVIRHNSGPQAGHTVEHDGKRHVFSHFGSGTLQGAPTLLCHRFAVNPILFNQEWDELQKLGVTPEVYIDAKCVMTTPLDIALNQLRELSRGDARHGSVGLGFGETIDRSQRGPVLRVQHPRRDLLESNLGQWFLDRYAELPQMMVTERNEPLIRIPVALWRGEFQWTRYWEAYGLMMERARVVSSSAEFLQSRVKKHDLIFEGAQGLALHQDRGLGAPDHATWSRTGLEDVVELLDGCAIEGRVQPHYVSRTYLTRHGNGPLLGEEPMPDWVVDPTNVPNEWQGTMRFAPFDARFTLANINRDIASIDGNRLEGTVEVLTCADQVPELTAGMTRGFADVIFHSPRNEAPELYQYRGT